MFIFCAACAGRIPDRWETFVEEHYPELYEFYVEHKGTGTYFESLRTKAPECPEEGMSLILRPKCVPFLMMSFISHGAFWIVRFTCLVDEYLWNVR